MGGNQFGRYGRKDIIPHFSKGEKRLLIAVSLFVVIITAITLWLHYVNSTPVADIPTPLMPNPNARDYYLKAAGAFVPYQVPLPSGDKYLLRFNSWAMLHYNNPSFGQGPGIAVSAGKPDTREPSLAELQGLVRVNAPAFAVFHEGLNYDYQETPMRSFHYSLSNIGQYRTLAIFLAINTKIKCLNGDWNGAANMAIDTIHFGEDIPRDLVMGFMNTGLMVQKIGGDGLKQTFDHLNATQARMAARRLEEVIHRHTSFADALLEDKWFKQARLLELLHSANWRQELLHRSGDRPGTLDILKFYTTSKRQLFNDYTRYVDAQIVKAKRPLAAAGAAPPPPKNNFLRSLASDYPQLRIKYAVGVARNNLLIVCLALRAYRLEHGNYPAVLGQLTPSYLNTVPLDPCGAGEILHYHRSGQGYSLYSVGVNGKDDHGALDDIVEHQP